MKITSSIFKANQHGRSSAKATGKPSEIIINAGDLKPLKVETYVADRNLYHVIPVKNGHWGVVRMGAAKASKTFPQKTEAINFGKQLSASQKGELVIHRKDGTIQNASSYFSSTPTLRKK